MSEEKKFYRTTLTLTFLSDQPVDDLDADALVEQSNSGDLVMSVAHRSSKEVNAIEMASSLLKAGSEPSFFQIDDRAAFLGGIGFNDLVKWFAPLTDPSQAQTVKVIDIEGSRIKDETTVLTVQGEHRVSWMVQASQVFPVD